MFVYWHCDDLRLKHVLSLSILTMATIRSRRQLARVVDDQHLHGLRAIHKFPGQDSAWVYHPVFSQYLLYHIDIYSQFLHKYYTHRHIVLLYGFGPENSVPPMAVD